jgi:hypothetical protein
MSLPSFSTCSTGIETGAHNPALRSRRRRVVRRRYQGREQLVLELQRHDQPAPTTVSATGLVVEALADLLLAALGIDVGMTAATGGGVDERQDHA